MLDARRRGLFIGLLLLLYMAGSGYVDFALRNAHPAPSFLAPSLGILTESFWLGIAVIAYPLIAPRSRALGLLLVALGALILTLGVIENLGGAEWAHLVVRMTHGAAMLVLYPALFRTRHIPRLLAGLGVIASLLQVVALAMPFFHREVAFGLLAPTGVCQFVLVIWLIGRGFAAEAPTSAERGPDRKVSSI